MITKSNCHQKPHRRVSPFKSVQVTIICPRHLDSDTQVKTRIEEQYRAGGMQLRDKVEEMQADFKQEQKTTFAVTADMARQ